MFVQVFAWPDSCGTNFNFDCLPSGRSPLFRIRTSNPSAVPPETPTPLTSAGLKEFAITPLTPPSYFYLDQRPVTNTVLAGQAVTLSPRLQSWGGTQMVFKVELYKNGFPIPYGPFTVGPGDSGRYTVLAWHKFFHAWSGPTWLQVVSPPALARISPGEHGDLEILLRGQSPCSYTLEASTNLGIWSVVTNQTTSSGTATFIDSDQQHAQKFYRARLEQ
jgi:hypothetical protein